MKRLAILITLSVLCAGESVSAGEGADARVLRVCADPNNLPFSNAEGAGFENQLAQMIASKLGERVEYFWWAQRRGFFRQTLNARKCDLVMGVPTNLPLALTTRPYYRSSYAFVYRLDRHYELTSLDDPRLRSLKIGVHILGGTNPPPALALAERGIVDNVTGYSIYGDYRKPNPPADLVSAIAAGHVDVGLVWGPIAGYFARRSTTALTVTPIADDHDETHPMSFSISAGVRKGDDALRDRVDAVLMHERNEIDALLAKYGVPMSDEATEVSQASPSRRSANASSGAVGCDTQP